jgi:hypothetical protein
LRNSSCYFFFRFFIRLIAIKRHKERASRFPLYAQSDTRSLKTSGRKRFFKNKHSPTYSLTRLLLFFFYQGLSLIVKIEFSFDSCEWLVILLTLKRKREKERKKIIAFFVNRKS